MGRTSVKVQTRRALWAGAALLFLLGVQLFKTPNTDAVAADLADEEQITPGGAQVKKALLDGPREAHRVAEADAVGQLHVIRVLTLNDSPIPGAMVVSSSSIRQIGVASSTGEIRCTSEDLGFGLVAVTAEGFIGTEVKLAPTSMAVDIHLKSAAEISGVVLDPTGLPLGRGMTVVAVSPRYHFDDRALALSLSGSPLIPVASADENGSFVLKCLDPDLGYRLFAAGLGYASFDQSEVITPGSATYVEVHALPVYGVVLALRDEQGNRPPLADLEGKWHGSATPLVHADWLYTTKWTARLLGLEPDCSGEIGFHDTTWFFASHEDLGESLAVRYRSELPGYSPIDIVVNATRAIRCVPKHDLLLKQVCNGFGEIAVTIMPPSRIDSLAGSTGGRACRLRLRELSTGTMMEVRLQSLVPAGLEVVSGIPYGDYAVTFVAPHQLFAYPQNFDAPVFVRVGPEPTTVEVPLPATGTIEIELSTADGLIYNGPLMGSHVWTQDDALDAFYFSSGPYRIPLLPSGEYRFVLDSVLGPASELELKSVFVRGRDETTMLSWQIPP